MSKVSNPLAFARPSVWSPDGQQVVAGQSGMSLRDWFAGQALVAVVPACAGDSRKAAETAEEMFARKAYALADAMLAERAKP